MMLDWKDQNQLGDTLWGEFDESEDHIVPHFKKGNTLFALDDYRKKKRNEQISSAVRSTEQTSGAKNNLPGCNLENSSSNTNEGVSASTLEMDTWPDLPNLNASPHNGYNNGKDLDFIAKELINGLSDATNLNSVRAGGTVQLDGEPELVSDEQADKGSDIFLDFDWDNIGDIDDLDRYFRNNDTISIHDMIGDADEFLSPYTEVISSTAQSIQKPYIPLCNNSLYDQGCSSSQLDGHSDGIRNPSQKEKTADSSSRAGGKTVGGRKKLLRTQKKAEPRSMNKPPENLTGACDHISNKKQFFRSPVSHDANVPNMFQTEPVTLCSSHQVIYKEYGYPTDSVTSIAHGHAERNQKRPTSVADKFYPDTLNDSKSFEKLSDVVSRPVTMTPQQKIDKLRRRQQMQAMLAIQKQQQHYRHQITGIAVSVSQACSQESQSQDVGTGMSGIEECANKLPPSKKSLPETQDEPERLSMLIDCKSLEETIYYQLQDSLRKLDVRVRLCFRDSLFRLAKSAIKRQSISDCSTNKGINDADKVIADEETNHQDRLTRLPDSETITNHIDRIVAHFLFHSPLESCRISLDIPQSPNM